MIDAVICLWGYRFKMESISHLRSGSVILGETACFGLSVWALLLSLDTYRMPLGYALSK
jgi:hypothetical protein